MPFAENPANQEDNLLDMPFVKDNAVQQMAFSQQDYPVSHSQIQGWLSGSRQTVTYYSSQNSKSNVRTNISDSPELRSVIHSAYERWDDFEITLGNQWNNDTNTERKSQTLTFTARMYPKFIAKNGDLLTCAIGDNKVGLFKVTNTNTTTWREQRCSEFGAYLIKEMDQPTAAFLAAATIRVLVFDKASLLAGAGTNALLTEDNYTYLQEMRRLRDGFCSTFYQLFFNNELCTIMRPDGYYDPYIVRFANNLADITITRRRAVQLLVEIEDSYQKSLWARLEDMYFHDLSFVVPNFICKRRSNRQNDTFITALSGHGYISLDYSDPQKPNVGQVVMTGELPMPYVFSNDFYMGAATMSAFESIVYNAITTRQIADVGGFVTGYLRTWRSLSREQLFYRLPLYVWLMDIAMDNVARRT